MHDTLIEGSWCHLVWHTAGRRAVFKLAAHASFCERVLIDCCQQRGWRVEAVVVYPDTIRALVRVHRGSGHTRRARGILEALARRLRRHHLGPAWPRRFWQRSGWCVRITNPGAAARIRRHLLRVRGADHRIQYASNQRAARTMSWT